MNSTASKQETEQRQGAPFRLWGYGGSVQAILLTCDGLVIRNGDERVLIPKQYIRRFQEQLAELVEA